MAIAPLQGQAELDESSRLLRWNYVLMTALGLWPTSPSNFRFFLTFGYMLYYMILEYLDLFLFIDDFNHVILNLVENITFSQIILRMYILRISQRELRDMINELKKDFDAKDYTDEERKTFISYNIKCKTFVKMLISNTALTATSFYMKPFLGQISEIIEYAGSKSGNSSIVFLLPYHFYTFYELKDAPTYFWTYGSQLPFVFVSGFGHCAGDCIMLTMIYHVSGQMAILAMRIVKINPNSLRCQDDLNRILKSHLRLLRLGKLIQETFETVLFFQLMSSTFLVCLLGYQILLIINSGEGAILISLFAFIVLVLLILYIFCLAGENLLIECNRVCNAYYNCNWYEMSVENSKIILFCIHRSQKPLRIIAGKFSTFCLATFTDTIKTAMGYLSVLRKAM